MKIMKKLFKELYPEQQGSRTETLNVDPPFTCKNLAENKQKLIEIFSSSSDFSYQKIKFGNKDACLFYVQSMVDEREINTRIHQNLKDLNRAEQIIITDDDLDVIREKYFSALNFHYSNEYHQLVHDLLNGYIVLFIDRFEKALSFAIDNIEFRSITEPSTQTIIRGPKDSFTESISTNISLIRRRVKNPKLIFEEFIIGVDSRTKISIGYIDGIVNQGILQEAKSRLQAINLSSIMDSGNIEESITDEYLTPFPLVFNTERPDVVAAGILEGKIGIIVDGSPFVLVIPAVLTDFFQSSEDYYQPYLMASFVRIIRYVSFMVALILPSLYVSIVTFHQELLPTNLLVSIQAQREGVPFPAVIEVLIMELTFEILREAGVRMPRAVGQTVSIVGALVIGQAAVEAGLVSNVLVIVVAFTAIASFVSPIYNFSITTRLIRFVLIFAAAIVGLYGILLVLILMVAHLASLRSFGVPYLASIAPLIIEDQQDVFVRLPNWSNRTRPSFLKTEQNIKFDETRPPSPPKKED